MIVKNKAILDELKRSVIYEVNIRQYTPEGSFKAFSSHLPRLKAMGVDIIWLMPIHPIGKINRKGTLGSYYSISDHQDINPEFGNKEDFGKLVQEIHALGMKIIIDWVANHAAWDHVWTETQPEYFVKEADGRFHSPYDWTDVIQLDHQNRAAHEAMRAAMCYWVSEFDIDGFRADLAHLTPLHYWKQARQECEMIKPGLIWLAETEDAAFYEAFDIVYAWKWMHTTEHFCRNQESVSQLTNILFEQNKDYPEDALQLYFTSNHDENSWNGTEFEKYGAYAHLLTIFSMFYPSAVPLIYSGQEIPNRKRLAFFEKDALDWNQSCDDEIFFRNLISLRKQDWSKAEYEPLNIANRVFAFRLSSNQRQLMVMLNFGQEGVAVQLNDFNDEREFCDIISREYFTSSEDQILVLPGAGYKLLLSK
jgi:glycosidase